MRIQASVFFKDSLDNSKVHQSLEIGDVKPEIRVELN